MTDWWETGKEGEGSSGRENSVSKGMEELNSCVLRITGSSVSVEN